MAGRQRLRSRARRMGDVSTLRKICPDQVKQGSPLPVQLEKAGHQLRHAGMTTKIGSDGFSTVDILELDLGK